MTLEPRPRRNAFVAGTGNLDAAVTYEPYLSLVRDKPESGKLIANSLQYPMVFDTFGCTPKFIKENPKAVKALVESYFQALDMIAKDKTKAFTIMGADVKQTAEQFEKSQSKTQVGRPRSQQEVLQRRDPGLQQGGGRPAAGDRRDQDAAGQHGYAVRHQLPQLNDVLQGAAIRSLSVARAP